MTPSAEPANAAAERVLVPERVLDEGEIVILAMKPSAWFVLIVSWPVLAVAALVAAAGLFAGEIMNLPRETIALLAFAAMGLRIIVASLQWMSRLYVLTNLRFMRISGMIRPDVFACPLRKIRDVQLQALPGEKMLALGSLFFSIDSEQTPESSWTNISHPEDVLKTVKQAISKAP